MQKVFKVKYDEKGTALCMQLSLVKPLLSDHTKMVKGKRSWLLLILIQNSSNIYIYIYIRRVLDENQK